MEVFVARQPIFDKQQRVYGYELLYRSGTDNQFREPNGDQASLSVIRNSLLVIGPEKLTGGKKAFINFTRNLLLNQAAFFLPREIAVIEVLEDVAVDEELVAACRQIKKRGYLLALDDFVLSGNENNPLTQLADIIKVDFRATGRNERKAIIDRFGGRGRVRFLAEKTETREEFQDGVELGYVYFQGYFFSKPVIIARKDIPGYKINYLRILNEVNKEDADFQVVQQVIERDPSLTYKLLQYINSAFFGLQYRISSIKQALVLLGASEIRKWASLAILVHLGQDQPGEVMRVALLRARFCEELAARVGIGARKSELFLMGMFSLMDVFLGRPLAEVLQDVPLSEQVKEALLGRPNVYRAVYDAVLSYERGDWEEAAARASKLGLNASAMPAVYAQVIEWVDKTTRL